MSKFSGYSLDDSKKVCGLGGTIFGNWLDGSPTATRPIGNSPRWLEFPTGPILGGAKDDALPIGIHGASDESGKAAWTETVNGWVADADQPRLGIGEAFE
jgi:hypothetical protein